MQWKTVTCGVLSLILSVLSGHAQVRPSAKTSAISSAGNIGYGNVPLMFEANQGQTDPQVQFLSRGSGYSVFLTKGGVVLALRPSESSLTPSSTASAFAGNHSRLSPIRQLERARREQKSTVLGIDLVGSAANPVMVGEQPLSTKVNYFIGQDPSKWRRNVPTYGKIRYRNVYPGIDLVYYGNNHAVEYDFDLAPGADAGKIQFAVKGADSLKIDANGDLVLTKGTREMRFQTPILYQEINGVRSRVPGAYALRDSTHVGFEVGGYDNTKSLVIDPVLVYSTFLGGSGDDFSNGIAVDSTGDAYVVGLTDSPDFPLANIGMYNPTQPRMFLTKLNSAGSALLFADYFGGTSGGDEAFSVALDSSGNAYVTGVVASSDFPVVNAYQSTLAGSQDAFLVKFAANGSSIIYSTYLGGSNLKSISGSTSQFANSVSVDPAGEAVIAGVTAATNFPTVNAYQSSVSTDQFGDWGVYGFLTKFAADGASLVYSTYLAGSTLNASSCAVCFPDSEIMGVVTDASGNAYVTGNTATTDFPVTSGAFATTYMGYSISDVGFVSKFTSSGGIAYSTYLGGLTSTFLTAIAVDTTGSAYVTGFDLADDSFPIVTSSICDPSSAVCNGAIIAKLDPTGSSLIYSTYLGNNDMFGQAIQVDASGDAFIVGSGVQFDQSNPIQAYAGNSDVVVAEINPGATTVLMATFLGGQGWESAADSLALDNSGAVYVTGVTQSSDFPVTQSAFQKTIGGQTDTFIAKINPVTAAPAVALAPYALQFASQAVGTPSAAQTVVMRNMGSAPLIISGITIGPDFAETDDCGATLAAASFCSFTVTFTPSAAAIFNEALTISDNATDSPHSVSLAGTGGGSGLNFTISADSNQAAISPGGTAVYPMTISPDGGAYTNPVTLACSGAPSFSTCTVSPNSVTPGDTSSTVSVSVTTSGQTARMGTGPTGKGKFYTCWLSAQLAVFGVVVLGVGRRFKSRRYLATPIVLMLLLLVGCGRTMQSPVSSNATPPGTYNLNITATSGSLQHSMKLTLIVQ